MRAMILAAGRGERMRPLSDHTPKALLAAGGKALVAWHLEKLAASGFRDVIVNHAHLGQMIESALGDGRSFGVKLSYSPEQSALETAGGIANALQLLGNDPFLVVNADIYSDYDFSMAKAAADQLLARKLVAHIVLVANPPHHSHGDFALKDGMARDRGAPMLTFSGIGVYAPQLFHPIAPGSRAPLAPLLREAIKADKVSGELFSGFWVDAGTPERLQALNQRLHSQC